MSTIPAHITAWAAHKAAERRGDLVEAERQHRHWLDLLISGPRADDALQDRQDQLAALELRLDAARRKVSPGQLGLDFTTAPPATGGKAGGGEPCGESWIDPRKTCRKGSGQAAAADAEKLPQSTAEPFSAEVMARITGRIRARTFATRAARHDGVDLAKAMEKIANAPGLVGENARGALAFMHEADIRVIVAGHRDATNTRGSGGDSLPPAWDPKLDTAGNFRALNDYVGRSEDVIARGRAIIKSQTLLPPGLVEAIQADNTLDGRFYAKRIEIALNGHPDAAKFDAAYSALKQGIAAVQRAQGPEERDALEEEARRLYSATMIAAMTSGPFEVRNAVGVVMKLGTAEPGTGGHYVPRGRTYWAAATPGAKASELYADEIDPARVERRLAEVLRGRPDEVFGINSVKGHTDSERSLAVHLHELGHAVHDFSTRKVRMLPNADGIEELSTIYSSDPFNIAPPEMKLMAGQRQGPTQYGNTNTAELFAEGFAAYVLSPDALKSSYPGLYQWVQYSLKRARTAAVRSRNATQSHMER